MTPSSASAGQFLNTCVIVALAIAAIFTVDTFLARMEERETQAEAARTYREAQALLRQGRAGEAIEQLRDAIATDRGNQEYQRTLAQAEMDAGKYQDAQATLETLLSSDSTSGEVNLLMARVQEKEGNLSNAVSFYHRAVYGAWKQNADAMRRQVRFELIELLAKANDKEELLAELLAVQDQAPNDVPTRLRIGRLFLEAGTAARAADVFRAVLRQAPNNAEAYAGLGEADFMRGDYRAASSDFAAAVRLDPKNPTAAARLDLSNQILELDPTRRGLSVSQRFTRSRQLLQMTADAAGKCMQSSAATATGAGLTKDVLDRADKSLQERVPAARQDAASEADMELAEQIWQARKTACPPPAPNDLIGLVLARAAQ